MEDDKGYMYPVQWTMTENNGKQEAQGFTGGIRVEMDPGHTASVVLYAEVPKESEARKVNGVLGGSRKFSLTLDDKLRRPAKDAAAKIGDSQGGGADGGDTELLGIKSSNNLNMISKGVATYLNEVGNNRFYPASLGSLFDKGIVPDRSVFVSPLDPNPPRLANGLACSYESIFDRFPDRVFEDNFPPNHIVAWDCRPFFRGSRSVVFFDSHVELVPEDRFQVLLRQIDEVAKRLPRRTTQK